MESNNDNKNEKSPKSKKYNLRNKKNIDDENSINDENTTDSDYDPETDNIEMNSKVYQQFLNELFPSLVHYVVIVSAIGVPILVGVGYAHFKRSSLLRFTSSFIFIWHSILHSILSSILRSILRSA